MKRLSSLFTSFSLLAALLCGCSAEPLPSREAAGREKEATTCVRLVCDDFPSATKSSVGASESAVANVNFFVFDALSGILDKAVYAGGGAEVGITLTKGHDYDIYALANIGDVTSVVRSSYNREGVFSSSFRHAFASFEAITASGVPLSSQGCVRFAAGSADVLTIPVERLLAKYTLRVDRSGLSGSTFAVKSARIRQNALSFLPFGDASERRSEAVCDGDAASPSDIATLNAGGAVSFYVLENRQGVLLPSNADPWAKVPGNISSRQGCCTFLEVLGSYSSDTKRCGDITYRMYLGADATRDFNVTRNSVYSLSLRPTDAGTGASSWKIDPGDVVTWGHELKISPTSVSLKSGGSATLSATWYTYTYTNGVHTGTSRQEVGTAAAWSSSAPGVAGVREGSVIALSPGSAVITASYSGSSASATISVTAPSGGSITIGGDDDGEDDGGTITY